METSRIVIDALKRAIEEWVNTGTMSTDELNNAILAIDKLIDKAIVSEEEHSNFVQFKEDLLQIKRLAHAKLN